MVSIVNYQTLASRALHIDPMAFAQLIVVKPGLISGQTMRQVKMLNFS